MSLRLLLMAGHADYRLLVRKHVEIDWPDAVVVEHRLGEDAPLDADFAATGYDAVVIVTAPPVDAAERLTADLLAKAEFAPVVLVELCDAPEPRPEARPGLYRIYGRKIDRHTLLETLRDASAEHRQSLSLLRTRPEYLSLIHI